MARHPDVDPRMYGVEHHDAKHGARWSPPLNLRYLRRDMASAESLGRIGRKIARRMKRRFTPAA